MRYTFVQYRQIIKEKYKDDDFEILEYDGTSKPGIYFCNLCKKEYRINRMGKLLSPERKHICSHCWASSYTQEILDFFPNNNLEFIQLGYNEKLHKPTVVYRCKRCLEESEKPFVEFLKHPTCIHCGYNAKRRSTNGFIQSLPKEFTLLEQYQGKDTKVLFKHSCGFIFKARPHDIMSGHTYCPKCSKKSSKGEREIMNYLILVGLDFEKEKIFSWSDKKRYDFFIPQLNLLIEYHGIQHYKEVTFFERDLKSQKEVDAWKKEKAISEGYDFLEISYEDFDNIKDILAQRLSRKGVGAKSETKDT